MTNFKSARQKELNKKSNTDAWKHQNEHSIKHSDPHHNKCHTVQLNYASRYDHPTMPSFVSVPDTLTWSFALSRAPARIKQSSWWWHFVLPRGTAEFTGYMHFCLTRQKYHKFITLYILQHRYSAAPGLKRLVPVSHTDDPGSLPGQSIWDLLRTLALVHNFSWYFGSPLSVSFHQAPYAISHHRRYVISANENIGDLKKNGYDNKPQFSFLTFLNCYQHVGQHLSN
jgi:hypothetical protein